MERSRAGVRSTYEAIADHFAETRSHPWPEVTAFLEDAPDGDLGLDVGCGNGRHLAPLSELATRVVGIDVSPTLLEIAAEHCTTRSDTVMLVQGDASALPIADGAATVALYVATLHHLPSRTARVASLDELARVLAPDGRALVSVWSTEHDRFDRERGFDTTVEWTLPDGETVPRFYHIYDPDEFGADLASSALSVETIEVSSGNCYGTVGGPSSG